MLFRSNYLEPNSNRTWKDFKQDLKETGSDLYNNFIGSTIGGLPIDLDTKENLLKKAHSSNLLSVLQPNITEKEEQRRIFLEDEQRHLEDEQRRLDAILNKKRFPGESIPSMEFEYGGNVWEIVDDKSDWEIIK